MGIERAPCGRGQFYAGEQAGELIARLGELGTRGVEDLRNRAPAGPARQDALFSLGRRAVLSLDLAQRCEGLDVGADSADGAGWCEVGLTPGAE